MNFSHRQFFILSQLIEKFKQGENLNELLQTYGNRLEDFNLALTWYRHLRKNSNWSGFTMAFHIVVNHHIEEMAGNEKYRQLMFEDNGLPVGYLRTYSLSRDSETRRRDCTKIEETLVSELCYVRDPSLLRYMHDVAAKLCYESGRSRVTSELGLGISPKQYRSLALQIKRLSTAKSLTAEEQVKLKRAERNFNRDWVKTTVKFITDMGFEIDSVAVREFDADSESSPQVRIYRKVRENALTLPPYKIKDGKTYSFTGDHSLIVARKALEHARAAACLER